MVVLRTQVGGHHALQARVAQSTQDVGSSAVGQVAKITTHAPLQKGRVARGRQHLRVVVGFDQQCVAARQLLQHVVRRMAQIGQDAQAGGAIGTGVTLSALGNKDLRPEFSAEYEGGFDLGGFNGATNFELTYYSKSTKDALIARDIAPSIIGISSQTVNIGRTKTAGLEFVLNQRIIDGRMIAANLNITGSTTRNKLVTLGDGVSPIFTGNRTTQKNTTGYPLFGLWGRTYTINDRNGDGIVQAPSGVKGSPTYDAGDIIISDTAQFIAPTYPKLEMAISPSLELFNHKLRFNAQFDHKSGFKKLNNTLRHQCQGGGSCRGLYDPTASLEQQAAAVAINSYGSLTGFYKDGAFTRFRELSAAYQVPDRIARAVHATRLNLIVTGRNLAVWTKYDGVDPEATVGNSDARGFEEYFSTPPLRTFTFRVNFTF